MNLTVSMSVRCHVMLQAHCHQQQLVDFIFEYPVKLKWMSSGKLCHVPKSECCILWLCIAEEEEEDKEAASGDKKHQQEGEVHDMRTVENCLVHEEEEEEEGRQEAGRQEEDKKTYKEKRGRSCRQCSRTLETV